MAVERDLVFKPVHLVWAAEDEPSGYVVEVRRAASKEWGWFLIKRAEDVVVAVGYATSEYNAKLDASAAWRKRVELGL